MTILDFKGEHFEKFIAWARYLYWCDLHRRNFDACFESDATDEGGTRFFALMAAWYASLWVVIEGWKEIQLSDPQVDELLEAAPRFQDLLKRFRHGVYHYQPRIIEGRLTEFLSQGESAMTWACLLHDQFCQFYWQLLLIPSIPTNLATQIQSGVRGLVGWVPKDISAAKIESLLQTSREAIATLDKAGDLTSDAARDVLQAVAQSHDAIAVAELKVHSSRSEALASIRASSRSN